MKSINWGLTQELIIYLADRKNIRKAWFSSANQKKYVQERVTKLIPSYISVVKINIEENKFNIYLKNDVNEGLKVYINDPRISKNEIEVVNVDQKLLNDLITESEIINSKVTQEVEAVFSSNSEGTFGFIHNGMKNYHACFDEMIRQLNCSINKRTTNWVPGHRYDSVDYTYYYLGEFYKKADEQGNYTCDETRRVKYKLVTTDIENCKTINDVLKTKPFIVHPDKFSSKGIYLLEKSNLMVDSGEVLKNDVIDINYVLWEDIINNSKTIENILVALSLTKDNLSEEQIKYYKNKFNPDNLLKIIKDKSLKLLSKFVRENISSQHYLLDPNSLSNSFLSESLSDRDNYVINNDSYKIILLSTGINLDDYSKEVIKYYKNYEIFENYDIYIKYYKEYNKFNSSTVIFNSRNAVDKPLDSIIPAKNLREAIKTVSNYALDNHGIGITDLYITSEKNKEDILRFTVTLDDIIGSDLVKMTDDLKEEILSTKFYELGIVVEKDYRF